MSFGAAIASAGGAGSTAVLSTSVGFGTSMSTASSGGGNGSGPISAAAAAAGAGAGAGGASNGASAGAGAGLSAANPAAPQLDAPEGAWTFAASLAPPQPLPLSNNISISATAPLPHNLQPRLSLSGVASLSGSGFSSSSSAAAATAMGTGGGAGVGAQAALWDNHASDGAGLGSNQPGSPTMATYAQAQERVKKLPRPRQNVKSTSSTFINRVQGNAELTKILAARTEADPFSFLNVGRSFVWLADAAGRIKEPLLRITFTSAPTCHDVNPYTRTNDRLDIIIGFASTGDLLWLDPLTTKYTRINKGGAVSSSGVTQVRWLPPAVGSDLMFMATHADGTVIVYDATRDDPQQGHFVPGVWTPRGSVIPSPALVPASGGLKGNKSVKDRKFRRKDKDKDKARPGTASSTLSAFNSGASSNGHNGPQPMMTQLSAASNAMSSSDNPASHGDTDDDAQEVLDNASVSTGDGQQFGSHRRSNNVSTSSTATVQGTPSGAGSPYVSVLANNASSSSLGSTGGGGGGGSTAANGEAARKRRGSASSFLDKPFAVLSGSGGATRGRANTGLSATSATDGGLIVDSSLPWDPQQCMIVTRPGFGTFSTPRGNDSIGAPTMLPVLVDALGGGSHLLAGGGAYEEESGGWAASLSVPGKNKDPSWTKCNPVTHWRISKKRITDFAFSPDLLHVAFTSEDGSLRVVDMATERLLDTFQGYFGGLTCVCWSPDGRFLLTGGQDDLVTIWAPREGRIIARCQGHTSFVTGVSFDPWRWRPEERSYRFASVGEDCKLIFWDFSSAALKRPKGHAHASTSAKDPSHQAGAAAIRRSLAGSTFSLLDRHHAPNAHAQGHRGSGSGAGMGVPRGSIQMTDRQALLMGAFPLHADVEPVVHDAPARSEVAMLQPVVVQPISGPAVLAALAAANGPSSSSAGAIGAGTGSGGPIGAMPASYASTSSSSGGGGGGNGLLTAAAANSAVTGQDLLVGVRFEASEVLVLRKSGQIDNYARPPSLSATAATGVIRASLHL
ncbi:hypothetical protein OC834_002363 [Tilletia horrida]|nr:hypothetical protein OC834_002363 [Tilletia horrida]